MTVIPGVPEATSEGADSADRPAPRQGPAIGKAYREPATTPLKATVKPGDNRFDFELK